MIDYAPWIRITRIKKQCPVCGAMFYVPAMTCAGRCWKCVRGKKR